MTPPTFLKSRHTMDVPIRPLTQFFIFLLSSTIGDSFSSARLFLARFISIGSVHTTENSFFPPKFHIESHFLHACPPVLIDSPNVKFSRQRRNLQISPRKNLYFTRIIKYNSHTFMNVKTTPHSNDIKTPQFKLAFIKFCRIF